LLVYWLFRLTILLMRPFPLRVGYAIGSFVASICYYFFRRHRRALNENLARVLNSDDKSYVDSVARQAFRNFGRYVVDFIHFPVMTRQEIRRRLAFDQWDDLEQLAAFEGGVLIVTMHFGNWDHGAAALAAHDFPINAIADTFKYPRMNRLVQGSREKLGMKVIPMERVGPGVFRALRRGEILAMLIDVPNRDFAVRVPFFGAPAEVSSAPARIALRTRAWVVPAVVVRGPEDPTIIRPIIDISLHYEPTGNEEEDVCRLTALIMASLERDIRRYPEQWFIFRYMWNDQPEALRTERPEPSKA
jgi:KDO2-lipid IV(A) lauroyltransferase